MFCWRTLRKWRCLNYQTHYLTTSQPHCNTRYQGYYGQHYEP